MNQPPATLASPDPPRADKGVFGDLVGQDAVVAELRQAAAAAAAVLRGEPATGMTHAWLFTGPPGSGRSVAARSFAAAPERYLVLDATQPPGELSVQIQERVRDLLPDPVPAMAEDSTGSFPAIVE